MLLLRPLKLLMDCHVFPLYHVHCRTATLYDRASGGWRAGRDERRDERQSRGEVRYRGLDTLRVPIRLSHAHPALTRVSH